LIFLRHPLPEVKPGTCYGRTDLDVSAIGREQITRAIEITPTVKRVLASPALRCRDLAFAIAKRDGLDPIFDDRLWEMNMGEFEGLAWNALDRAKSEAWLADAFNNSAPGGESFAQVQARVLEAIEDHGFHEETAVVCHAGPIRAVQMAWQSMTFKEVFAKQPAYAEPIRLKPYS